MLLVLVNTSGGKEILMQLEKSGINTVAMLPSVYDAGLFGIGDALTGSLTESRIRRVLDEHKISAVIDALNDNEADASFTVSYICKEKEIPLFKYLPFEADYRGYWNVRILDTAVDAADILNSDNERTLMFGSAEKIKDIAQWVLDKRKLYTAVLKGSEMDIDFSLKSSIPFANIVAVGSIEGESDISSLAERYNITRFVCYENVSVFNKLNIAKNIDVEVLMIKKQKPDYYIPFDTVDKIVEEVKRIEEELRRKEEEFLKDSKKQRKDSENSVENMQSDLSEETEKNESENSIEEKERAKQNESAEIILNKAHNLEDEPNLNVREENRDSESDVSFDERNELLSKDVGADDSAGLRKGSDSENSNIEDDKTDNIFSVPKSKVMNDDGTVNMDEFVKYVKQEFDIE